MLHCFVWWGSFLVCVRVSQVKSIPIKRRSPKKIGLESLLTKWKIALLCTKRSNSMNVGGGVTTSLYRVQPSLIEILGGFGWLIRSDSSLAFWFRSCRFPLAIHLHYIARLPNPGPRFPKKMMINCTVHCEFTPGWFGWPTILDNQHIYVTHMHSYIQICFPTSVTRMHTCNSF